MLILNCPRNPLPLVIVRDYNHYYLAFSRGYYGHCPTRFEGDFNRTTAGEEPHCLPNGNPYIWLEPPVTWGSESGREALERLISQLLEAQPRPPIRLTGRRRSIPRTDDGVQRLGGEAVEIVIMLSEDELAHCCYYCAQPEDERDLRYKRIGGEGHSSTYGCPNVRTCFGIRDW
ncbi:hypothetical protein DFH09DRAFT_946932 [Mycena vulgaris]|nr:hypothetical protein DFH09DRAFT_946932 [Mycena vulgaris]